MMAEKSCERRERQDMSCTYLAHHDLESVVTIIIIITTMTTTTIAVVVVVATIVVKISMHSPTDD